MGFRRFFSLPASERTVTRDIDDEVTFHIESRVEELVRAGNASADARAQALREFGDIGEARSELAGIDRLTVRKRRRSDRLDALRQDLRLAARTIGREPVFTVTVVLTLGLGIGVNAVMFGITDRLMFRPPPHITNHAAVKRVSFNRGGGDRFRSESATHHMRYQALRAGVRGFASAGAYFATDASLGTGLDARRVRVMLATASYFTTLGVRAQLGRFYDESEDRPGDARTVIVLSHRFWQANYAGQKAVLGRTVQIGRRTYTVIGVAPRGFTGIDLVPIDVFVPLSAAASDLIDADWRTSPRMFWLNIVARIAPNASETQVADQATTVARASDEEFAQDAQARVTLQPVMVGRSRVNARVSVPATGEIALWLSGVSLIVLLIAGANVVNILLARATRRQREIGIRLALGVGRARLFVHYLVETLALTTLGGALGLMLVSLLGNVARPILLPDVDWSAAPIDTRVLAYTAALVIATGLLASIAPAIQALRTNVISTLKLGLRAGTTGSGRLRTSLIAAQAMFSVLLLMVASLFVKSLLNVRGLDKGFDAERVFAVSWDNAVLQWKPRETDGFYQEAAARVRQLPAVEDAAVAVTTPFWSSIATGLRADGWDSVPRVRGRLPSYNAVAPEYFATMGTRLLRGRGILASDQKGSERVAVVNETMERTLWSQTGAIGKCLYVDDDSASAPCTRVVGVARDVLWNDLRETEMQYYLPLPQREVPFRTLFVRVRGDPASAMEQVRQNVQVMRANLPVADARLLRDLMDTDVRPWRLGATLFSGFGILALLLAAIGLYGVIAYDVTRRKQEMSVRIALGARARDVLGAVVGSASRVVLGGTVLGVLAVLFAAPRIGPLLFDVSPRDPTLLALVVGTLLAVGILAAAMPVVRALRIDPIGALKEE
ncbi:MAG: ADOP family duplicated permease [Longimicrobiales bacterium]